jgi:hypothetical protein
MRRGLSALKMRQKSAQASSAGEEGGTPRLLHEKIFDTIKYSASLAGHDA